MGKSSIEWTQLTWNPTSGCNKVTKECKNCYAEIMHKRLNAMGQKKYASSFNAGAISYPPHLHYPETITKPATFFVNSMSDLFHEKLPDEYILKVFSVMNKTPWHTYQVLTKREKNLLRLNEQINWTDNIWMGVSVGIKEAAPRINYLRKTNAAVKFISAEPLLEDLGKINLSGIDWLITGGESGHSRRNFNCNWARSLRDQCQKQNVKFFMKQVDKIKEIPPDLMIKEYPYYTRKIS